MLEMTYSDKRKTVVLAKGNYKGYKYVIVNYGWHPCCYIFLPPGHFYYGLSYDDININCHGGITFSEEDLEYNPLENDFWVIGWDYAHYNDYTGCCPNLGGKQWTTEELLQEVKDVIEQLKDQE